MTLATRTLACAAGLGLTLLAWHYGCSSAPKPLAASRPTLPPSAARPLPQPAKPPALPQPVPMGSGATNELKPVLPPDSDPTAPLVVHVPIEDRSGRALETFYTALERIGTEQRQARVVVYGASHVASDLYTDIVRSRLQARFGDAGVGFVQPLRAVSGYRSAGVTFEQANGWTTTHVKARTPLEDRYGLGGMYLSAPRSKKGALSIFTTRPHGEQSGNADSIELWYLKQPRGGKLRVTIDDGARKPLNTQAREAKPGYERYSVPDGQHRIELTAGGEGPVQLFGVVLERERPGVVVDSLGVPGSRARYHLLWNEALYREHLQRRKPDLVVLAYGTNESGDDDEPIERYESDLHKVLERIRGVVPQASCLLIGPSDRPIENPDGTFVDRPRTSQIVETQRKLATEFGCGFFDMVAFMGGRLSMLRWVNSLPPLGTPDYVHFTRVGYEALGNAVHAALMAGFGPASAPSNLPPTASTSLSNH